MIRTRLAAVAVVIFFVSASSARAQETVNPHFDEDLTGWTAFLAPAHQWSSVDADSDADSGSLLALKTISGTSLVQATQCVQVVPGMTLNFMVDALVLESGDPADITIDLTPFSDTSCQVYLGLNRVRETPTQGQWTRIFHGPHTVEEGVGSIEVGLGLSENWASTVPVSAHFDNATFCVFVDGFDTGTCAGWSRSSVPCVTPDVGLRVEVTWTTTGDPDPGDEVGTDLDLHLMHPDASGEWLGAYDCYQANPLPDWGTAGTSQNAVLVREDDDGTGPETIQITDPESVVYDVGVHYVDDLAYGASSVTVNVFIDGVNTYQYPGKTLFDGEFWHLGSVEWPGGSVTVEDSVTSGVP